MTTCDYKLSNFMHYMQGDYGMCWFTAILNTLAMSDGLSREIGVLFTQSNLGQTCLDPSNIAQILTSQLQKKMCLRKHDANYIANINALLSVYRNPFNFKQLLYECISRNKCRVVLFPNQGINGGLPSDFLVKFLAYIGYCLDNVCNVMCDFSKIRAIFSVNPRTIKYVRVCQDYLTNKLTAPNSKEPKIMIVNIFYDDVIQYITQHINGIPPRHHFYMGKYICLTVTNQTNNKQLLYVYKLDACILGSCRPTDINNPGHVITATTCKGKGYLLNSYTPLETNASGKVVYETNGSSKRMTSSNGRDCSVFGYDWQNWENKNEFYVNEIIGDPMSKVNTKLFCIGGNVINSQTDNVQFQQYMTPSPKLIYHRDVSMHGNILVYVLDGVYTIDQTTIMLDLETLHDDVPIVYKQQCKPALIQTLQTAQAQAVQELKDFDKECTRKYNEFYLKWMNAKQQRTIKFESNVEEIKRAYTMIGISDPQHLKEQRLETMQRQYDEHMAKFDLQHQEFVQTIHEDKAKLVEKHNSIYKQIITTCSDDIDMYMQQSTVIKDRYMNYLRPYLYFVQQTIVNANLPSSLFTKFVFLDYIFDQYEPINNDAKSPRLPQNVIINRSGVIDNPVVQSHQESADIALYVFEGVTNADVLVSILKECLPEDMGIYTDLETSKKRVFIAVEYIRLNNSTATIDVYGGTNETKRATKLLLGTRSKLAAHMVGSNKKQEHKSPQQVKQQSKTQSHKGTLAKSTLKAHNKQAR